MEVAMVGLFAAAPDNVCQAANKDLLRRLLTSKLLVLAPHMDDETLACGGTMLLHANKRHVHCLFATDGAASPAPLLPWTGRIDSDIVNQRRREAVAATAQLGISADNLRFLNLPDGRLPAHRHELAIGLSEIMETVRPDFVLVPFRYDVHPDHTALNRATRAVLRRMKAPPSMLEYFIYHRLLFVPERDVRKAVERRALVTVDTLSVASAKRDAIDCYVSQTTIRHDWQDRPILTAENVKLRCTEPECFLITDPSAPLSDGLFAHGRRIQLACLAARYGKRPKDRVRAFTRWLLKI